MLRLKLDPHHSVSMSCRYVSHVHVQVQVYASQKIMLLDNVTLFPDGPNSLTQLYAQLGQLYAFVSVWISIDPILLPVSLRFLLFQFCVQTQCLLYGILVSVAFMFYL